jgi:hypothetical protein
MLPMLALNSWSDPSASASLLLGLQICVTTYAFKKKKKGGKQPGSPLTYFSKYELQAGGSEPDFSGEKYPAPSQNYRIRISLWQIPRCKTKVQSSLSSTSTAHFLH